MLREVASELLVLSERWMEPLRGERDQALDQGPVVRLERYARLDELDETENELCDRRDVRVGQREVRRMSDRRGDARRGIGDRMIDERAQLSALERGMVTAANASSDDRDEERLRHRHRTVVIAVVQLLAKDAPIGPEIERPGEVLDRPTRGVAAAVVAPNRAAWPL
jgi:hypothetical protein